MRLQVRVLVNLQTIRVLERLRADRAAEVPVLRMRLQVLLERLAGVERHAAERTAERFDLQVLAVQVILVERRATERLTAVITDYRSLRLLLDAAVDGVDVVTQRRLAT